MATRRAIIIGGGIAGLAAAIALRKADYSVTVLEQAHELLPMGAALSLWGNAMAALSWLGADGAVGHEAAPIHQLGARDQRGRPILHVDMARTYAPGQRMPRLPTRRDYPARPANIGAGANASAYSIWGRIAPTGSSCGTRPRPSRVTL